MLVLLTIFALGIWVHAPALFWVIWALAVIGEILKYFGGRKR